MEHDRRTDDQRYEAKGSSDERRADGTGPRRRRNRHHASRRKSRPNPARTAADTRAGYEPEGQNAAEMRDARASGRTPGLSTADEPATAPLGTDAEAAGAPPQGQAVDREVDRAEQGRGMQGLTAEEAMKGRPGHPEESPRAFGKLVTIAAAILIALLAWALLF